MKRIILILITLLLLSLLTAIDFEFDGENRTRAAFYNDQFERDGGHIDNRLYLGLNGQLHPDLMMRVNLQFGDVIWGGYNAPYLNKSSYGGLTAAVDIKAYELFVDYRIGAIESNIRVGQQYWRDNMGLILDDSFSGIMLTIDDLAGFKTELGWVKIWEDNVILDDDYDYLLVNMRTPDPVPWGIFASYGSDREIDYSTLTLMPHASFSANPLQIDASAFMGMHFWKDQDTELGLGGAVKAKADLGIMDLGIDLLYATENGIETLSPYYQNGLYIYGIGKHHDGVNLYWNWAGPYSNNNDSVLSVVGSINAPLSSKLNFFGAAGILSEQGFEVNGGLEYDVIQDLMQLAGYAALGLHDEVGSEVRADGPTNYVLGTTLKLTF